jgi:hypothetical protein
MPFYKEMFTDDCPKGKLLHGGFFFRATGLGNKLEQVEKEGKKIVGIRIDNSNEIEFLFINDGQGTPRVGITPLRYDGETDSG